MQLEKFFCRICGFEYNPNQEVTQKLRKMHFVLTRSYYFQKKTLMIIKKLPK